MLQCTHSRRGVTDLGLCVSRGGGAVNQTRQRKGKREERRHLPLPAVRGRNRPEALQGARPPVQREDDGCSRGCVGGTTRLRGKWAPYEEVGFNLWAG